MLVLFPAIACFAGLTSGLLGIGGGMINGPLFVAMNLHPRVATSSCAFEILWTAISGVLLYFFAGKIGWAFIVWCVCIGFVAGLIGQFGLDAVLKRIGRPSVVVLLLGTIVGSACMGMLITGSIKIGRDVSAGKNLFYFNTYDFKCITSATNASLGNVTVV